MKIDKNRKLKGSVLLTVVSVMALLIIFMASTVTLATAANNRSHANYSDSQAEYTARAAIEGFSQALTTNNALAQSILAMDKGDTFTPAVVINDPGMGNVGYYDGNHWVSDKIKIEYIKDNWGYDEEKEEWANMQVLKVTATARVGKQEKSICYYLEKTGESSPSKSNNIKGFQTLGGGGMQNNGKFSGALCLGLGEDSDNAGMEEFMTGNDFDSYVTDGFVNGSLRQDTGSSFQWHVYTSDSHFVVTNDLGCLNSGLVIHVNYPYAKTGSNGHFVYDDVTQKDIPYLYVGGKITSVTEGGTWGKGGGYFTVKNEGVDNGRGKYKDAPFNVFAGSMALTKINFEGSDLYLFDDTAGMVSYIGGTPNGDIQVGESNLYKWSSSVVNKTASQFYSEGGSIYCNHELYVNKPMKVHGNLVVQGNLTLGSGIINKGDLEVDGDLVVNGTISDISKITCHGKIFYDHGGDSVAYYMAKNPEAADSLKPGYVKVENAEFGTLQVPNIEVVNKPVEGEIITLNNTPVSDPATVVVCSGKGGDWNWKIESSNEPIEIIGDIEAVRQWINEGGFNRATVYYVDGKGYVELPYYVSSPDGTPTTDVTIEPTTKYYKVGTQIISTEEADTKFLLCDNKGKVTETIVDFAYEYYIAGPDGEPTTEYTTELIPYTYYAYNKDGEIIPEKADGGVVFYKVDPKTKQVTEDKADGPVSYYLYDSATDSYQDATESQAIDTSGVTKYVAWYNPLVPATAQYYYYDVDPQPLADDPSALASHQITEAEAINKANTSYFKVSSYPTAHTIPKLPPETGTILSVYPTNMTWSALNSGSTKIIKQLSEARSDIGADENGNFDEDAYNKNYDYSAITKIVDLSTVHGGGTISIDQSTVITGTTADSTTLKINVKATSGMFIVLKDAFFTGTTEFVVEGNDTVNFYLVGTNTFNIGGGIYTKRIYDAVKGGKTIRISESDRMNINMYGAVDSELITQGGDSIFCASAKCPYTALSQATTNGIMGDWRYVDNYNHITNYDKVNWVGSALLKSVIPKGEGTALQGLSNNFALLYTNSTDDADSNINNDQVIGANWYAKYYDAY
ncbi:MAG: hypothetical protein IKP25_02225 [Ruminococcus sp.]|nr:hypothetical protein [Ruminococcus sp.]